MYPTFFALFNTAGIACAADSDHTIFKLSDKLPVALAVSPKSPIPWDRIISDYKRNNPAEQEFFADYAYSFNEYLVSLEVEESWSKMAPEISKIVFFGYGSEDVLPSVFATSVLISEDGFLDFDEPFISIVNEENEAFCRVFGDFQSVSTLFVGSTRKTNDYFRYRYKEMFDEYTHRVMEECKGTGCEDYVMMKIEAFDAEEEINQILYDASENRYNELTKGLASFSIGDMVTAAETLVNANAKLSHLHSGAKGKHGETKEIAVMTIPEGLTWIKHSIYMRRTEI